MRLWKPVLALLLTGAAAAVVVSGRSTLLHRPHKKVPAPVWRSLEPGLDLGVLNSPRPSSSGDSKISALRIDPRRFSLRLLNASGPGQGKSLTAREWSRRNGLVAAINASMYHEDHRTSVALMRTRGHVNNPRLTRHQTVLAFDRRSAEVPPVRLIDRECDDFNTWKGRYVSFVQSIRMISCKGENVWEPGGREWSIAAVGVDHGGRILFLHSRSPYTPHDFIDILLALPLDLAGAMYVEGGPEAQLYVAKGGSGGRDLELVGSRGTSLFDGGDNEQAWPVPNVLGVVRRK